MRAEQVTVEQGIEERSRPDRTPPAGSAPEPDLPQGLPMPPNTGEMPPPKLPPAPGDDPDPPRPEPAPGIDAVPGL